MCNLFGTHNHNLGSSSPSIFTFSFCINLSQHHEVDHYILDVLVPDRNCTINLSQHHEVDHYILDVLVTNRNWTKLKFYAGDASYKIYKHLKVSWLTKQKKQYMKQINKNNKCESIKTWKFAKQRFSSSWSCEANCQYF